MTRRSIPARNRESIATEGPGGNRRDQVVALACVELAFEHPIRGTQLSFTLDARVLVP